MRDFEARRKPRADRLLRKPIDEHPLIERPRSQVTLVREIVETQRSSARQVEVVKHLVNLHGSPLTRRVRPHTLYTTPILLPLLLREEESPIHLLHLKGPGNIADNCYS